MASQAERTKPTSVPIKNVPEDRSFLSCIGRDSARSKKRSVNEKLPLFVLSGPIFDPPEFPDHQKSISHYTEKKNEKSISSINHQTARGLVLKRGQKAWKCQYSCGFADFNTHSKTACRGFESFCPCQETAAILLSKRKNRVMARFFHAQKPNKGASHRDGFSCCHSRPEGFEPPKNQIDAKSLVAYEKKLRGFFSFRKEKPWNSMWLCKLHRFVQDTFLWILPFDLWSSCLI